MTKHDKKNKMSSDAPLNALSDSQEMLLEKFFDGECTFVERFSARRLLKKNKIAVCFADTLRLNRDALRGHLPSLSPDLWSRVSVRLHEEDRSMHRIGFRENEKLYSKSSRQMFGWRSMVTASGIVLTLFVVAYPMNQKSSTSSLTPQGIVPVAYNGGSNSGPVQMLSRRIPSAVEVDWMRSDGRLQVMNESQARAPIIWVKRRTNRGEILVKQQPRSNGIVVLQDRSLLGIPVSSR